MRRLSKAQGILFFYFFDLALLLLLLLSFMPFMRGRRPQARDTALLNPAYRATVSRIELSCREEGHLFGRRTVCLYKQGGLWLGNSSDGNGEFVWPADAQAVERLLDYAAAIAKAYEKSTSRKDWDAFGLKDGDAFSLCFYGGSKKLLSSLYFGNEDSLTRRVYVRSSADDAVYALDSEIGTLLSAEESFWADPFLYPQCLTGLGRAEAEMHLRRGRLENIRPREGLPVDRSARLFFGNGAEICFDIYSKDGSYIVIPTLSPGPAASEEERVAILSINYRYGISGTTLENLLEECGQAD